MELKKTTEWIGARLLNPEDRERDVKLLIFAGGTIMAAFWLTREQCRGAITAQWVDAMKWFLLSISIGGAGWAAVDVWKGKADNGGSNDNAQ